MQRSNYFSVGKALGIFGLYLNPSYIHFGLNVLILSPSVPMYRHGNLSYKVQIAWSNCTAWSIYNNCHVEAIRNSSSPKLCEVYRYWAFTLSSIYGKSEILKPYHIHVSFLHIPRLWSTPDRSLCLSLKARSASSLFFLSKLILHLKYCFLVQQNTNTGAAELINL